MVYNGKYESRRLPLQISHVDRIEGRGLFLVPVELRCCCKVYDREEILRGDVYVGERGLRVR